MENSEMEINMNEPIEEQAKTKTKSFLSNLHDIVFWVAGVLLVFSLLFRVVVVSGQSMENTLLHGDWILLLSNVFYRNPEPGDVVVICKDSYDNGTPIIKRVIATEGQEVNIDFDEGIVYVDGKPLTEPYTLSPTNKHEGMDFPVTVPKGCVFVLGDNRNKSKDSRSDEIGFIDEREILGKAIFVLFPGKSVITQNRDLNRIGVIS